MNAEDITVKTIELATDTPVRMWKGNCFGVASAVVETGLVKGKAVYGHFIGEVHPNSYFGQRANLPFVQHGWVVLDDGRIFDPTRWCFEGDSPYIWCGENDGSYDEGGNEFRMAMMRDWPDEPAKPGEKRYKLQLGGDAIRELEEYGAELVDEEIDGLDYDLRDVEVTGNQLHWLANFPISYLSQQNAYDLFIQIKEHGLAGFIPIDNMKKILGD
jgi:hypothetical protein